MRNILKYASRIVGGGLICSFLLTSCDLDYKNTEDINPDNVWEDEKMILAYLNDIHGGKMPGWPTNGNNTDEALNGTGSMSDYARGVIDAEKDGQEMKYEYIDKINFFLDKLKGIPESILSETENKQLQGQALFWRAWDYWDKVYVLGGVPLVLEPQNVNDKPSLFIPRNKTSECVTQIIKDLDTAIEYLPATWDDNNYGRIDKGAAMAFKGRVLMFYASPLFNATGDTERWQDAYDANKEALQFLESVGKGLYPDYTQLWKDEQNEEVVMVNQYYYPDHKLDQSSIRPEPLTGGSANNDQPILSLLLAFPQKDGSKLILDVDRFKSDMDYNANFLTDFYLNRDDRFYTTVFCGGTEYPSTDGAPGGLLAGGQRYWCTWRENEDGSYLSLINSQINKGVGDGISGFFKAKGLDESLNMNTKGDGETDWIEIRFAEVLMNVGECANEIGKTGEALDVLYQIRKRAGIASGTEGTYGIAASTTDEIRQAYIDERFVEFALEGKRGKDLRRWKRRDILNNMKHRQGLYIVLNDNAELQNFDWTWDIKDDEVRKKFHGVYIENLDMNDRYTFNYSLDHWFYPIAKKDLDRNSKLEQNNEWGGTFDPLQ